mgnify:CR=1 FL=1
MVSAKGRSGGAGGLAEQELFALFCVRSDRRPASGGLVCYLNR